MDILKGSAIANGNGLDDELMFYIKMRKKDTCTIIFDWEEKRQGWNCITISMSSPEPGNYWKYS